MKDITFVDLEVTLNTCRVVDIGAVRSDRTPFHENSFDNLLLFLHQVPYIGGHNILKHDLSYLKPQFEKAGCRQPKIIDTLYLSSLLFPEKLHHQLSKDDKLQADKPNNPVNDSLKSLLLFEEEQNAFERLDSMLKMIYYGLLHDTDEFGGFFDYIDYAPDILDDLSGSILERFSKDICISSPLAELIISYPVELAYGLSLINCWNSSSGIPLWVLHNYPKVGWVMERLRDTPCENNECAYCRGAFNGKEGLKYFFKYDSFRTYEGEDLQQKAVEAAIEGESLLAVFPTGGGKSITFQLPALMSGKRIKGLTVVISPLQSLMKDQVDNLWKNEIMDVVTINGMLDPVERAHAIQRVEEGSVSILYISPESLRSKTIERLLVGRKVVRFVIDEAHCFSAWGQDFRVDYLYIGDFIRLLQEQKGGKQAVEAAIEGESLLAVFPTGGGKSITFQLPALMSGKRIKGLTVVISPLQSLMKDQVDNLWKNEIMDVVTINGMLDPVERAHAIQRVEEGSVSILYISPESLRSKTIERLLVGRKVVRFVIDEAHCFSAWGQDFRVDYLYIGDFIRLLQEQKGGKQAIPVSCFTATAKQNVIQDIKDYFFEKLNIRFKTFCSGSTRKNLKYKVFKVENEDEKYGLLRSIIEDHDCPAIVYVSRTRTAAKVAMRLQQDGFSAGTFHGKMETRMKTSSQNDFIDNKIRIMVATSAFGMGVDKKNVGLVVHYEISDSLENYVQEAGRAGRDESIEADCYVLFNEEDLDKHFYLLNQTKLRIKEIQQVWKAIKELTSSRISLSALELARKAGWNENILDVETRVTTAIAALEEAGYIRRGQNNPCVFADSILAKTAQEAIDRITVSPRFDDTQKEEAIRIIKKLISTRSRKHVNGEIPESRIDYISDHLGISRQEVMLVIRLLREENILADACDLTAYIKKGENSNRSLETVLLYNRLDEYLLSVFTAKEQSFNLKELRKEAEIETGKSISPDKLNRLLNFWSEKNWIKRIYLDKAHNYVTIARTGSVLDLEELTEGRHLLSDFIIRYLFEKTGQSSELEQSGNILVEFSMLELKEAYEKDVRKQLFGHTIRMEDIEDTLLYLSRIEALQIEGGFLVLYNRLQIDRLVLNNKMQYKQDDYHKLELFYANKIQQINIVGEYVRKMLSGNSDALEFVDDYFQLNYSSFLQKYFPGKRRDEINRKMTNTKLQRLLGELSETQLEIVKDDRPGSIVVMAGPGSGKTRVLVHKLAYLLLEEDVKHEQLLMLTFSRAAASEFRRRLWDLIGTAAGYVEIKTFHSYCFDLLGLQGSLEKSSSVIIDAVGKIDNGEVEINRITKTVLVIDEAQDMTEDEFALVEALIRKNEDLKVVAVGDDDQNIYSFRRSNSRYMRKLVDEYGARTHDLLVNFRSKKCLVEFANRFWETIPERMKQSRIISHDQDEGEIRIVQYQSPNMVIPLVQDICATPLIGTTCVLTQTNWEAIQVACLLKDKRMPVRLIQSNEGFRLCDMDEMRFFNRILGSQAEVHLIDEVCWAEAKQAIKNEYCEATSWEICRGIIQNFEQLYPCKYRSDWETYLFESKLEDFYAVRGETIVVSTIHKAKGKEFDNVFLLLNDNRDLLGDNQPVTDEKRREIYVALTRAKNKLSIHLNSYYPEIFGNEEKIIRFDKAYYPMPERLLFLLTHRDVWLDFFKDARRQESIGNLKSGMPLRLMEGGCCDSSDKEVVRFSNSFKKEIEKWLDKGYELKEARVNFVVYWKKTGEEEEVKVLLPEIVLVKVRNLNVSELMIL